MYRRPVAAWAIPISALWGCAPATAPPPPSSATAVAAAPAPSPPALVAVQEAALVESDCVRNSATVLSRDGNWALVAGRGQAHRAGSARVFAREGGEWVEQAVLTAADPEHADLPTSVVSLTRDGTRALLGAPGDKPAGSARVFARDGSTWTEQAILVRGSTHTNFAKAVALSPDGTEALVGAPGASGQHIVTGAVSVYAPGKSGWSDVVPSLSPADPDSRFFGYSIAFDAASTRVVVGALGDHEHASGVHVFARDGTRWTEEATLRPSGGTRGLSFGWSVAVSADGDRVLVGHPKDNDAAGGARVFHRTGTSWAEEAALTPADATAMDVFGANVALSGDGSRALLGGAHGTARLFVRTGTSWREALVLPPNGATSSQSYPATSLSEDGELALLGACVFRIEEEAP